VGGGGAQQIFERTVFKRTTHLTAELQSVVSGIGFVKQQQKKLNLQKNHITLNKEKFVRFISNLFCKTNTKITTTTKKS
jgi:hypothetical protein